MLYHPPQHARAAHSRPYMMFGLNMTLSLAIMYVVMFSMIEGWGDFQNNLNMFYMAVTMWAPMGILMLLTMGGMYPNRKVNFSLLLLLAVLTAGSLSATRSQALIADGQFVKSMIPHQSGAILMCRQASLTDPELVSLCRDIMDGQRAEIDQMERILTRLE